MIVNEVGEIDIDSRLLRREESEFIQLSNGCVCCSLRLGLAKAVLDLATQKDPHTGADVFDAILVETTGIADPSSVIQTFHNISDLRRVAQIDSIVAIADCEHLLLQLAAEDVASAQIGMADFVLLNKTDLVQPDTIQEAESSIRTLNPMAEVIRTTFSQVDWRCIIDANAFDISARIEADPQLLDELRRSGHTDISSVSFRFDRPFDLQALVRFIDHISKTTKIYRSKGFLDIKGKDRKAVFHGVNSRFNVLWGDLWPQKYQRTSELVFIGRDILLAQLKQGLERCFASSC